MNLKTEIKTAQKTKRSQAFFNGFNLAFYDVVVAVVSPLAWRCTLPYLAGRYQRFVSNNHLEVGPGTGYFLNRLDGLSNNRLALMDLSEACLTKSAKSLAKYQPQTYRQNILEPVTHDIEPFDSIGINYVMHCVPGNFTEKGIAFKHLAALLRPGGQIFGCSVLSENVDKNWLAKAAMGFLQGSGVFNNQHDNAADLSATLNAYFDEVKVEVIGPTAVFSGRKKAA